MSAKRRCGKAAFFEGEHLWLGDFRIAPGMEGWKDRPFHPFLLHYWHITVKVFQYLPHVFPVHFIVILQAMAGMLA